MKGKRSRVIRIGIITLIAVLIVYLLKYGELLYVMARLEAMPGVKVVHAGWNDEFFHIEDLALTINLEEKGLMTFINITGRSFRHTEIIKLSRVGNFRSKMTSEYNILTEHHPPPDAPDLIDCSSWSIEVGKTIEDSPELKLPFIFTNVQETIEHFDDIERALEQHYICSEATTINIKNNNTT